MRWLPLGALSPARAGVTSTSVREGKILVVGGRRSGDSVQDNLLMPLLASAELYDLSTHTRERVLPLQEPRTDAAAVLSLSKSTVLIVGGTGWEPESGKLVPSTSIESVDLQRGSVKNATLPEAISAHGAVKISDGNVLVVGTKKEGDNAPSPAFWHVDSTSLTARSLEAPNPEMIDAIIGPHPEGALVVGLDRSESWKVFVWNPSSGTWKSAPAPPSYEVFH